MKESVTTNTTLGAAEWQLSIVEVPLENGRTVKGEGVLSVDDYGTVQLLMQLSGQSPPQGFTRKDFGWCTEVAATIDSGLEVRLHGVCAVKVDSSGQQTSVTFDVSTGEIQHRKLAKWRTRRAFVRSMRIIDASRFSYQGMNYTLLSKRDTHSQWKGFIHGQIETSSETDVEFSDHDLVHTDLLLLISFAQGVRVEAARTEYEDKDGKIIKTELHSIEKDQSNHFRCLPLRDPDLSNFLQTALPIFRSNESSYQLTKLVGYYVQSLAHPYIEVRFALASIWMEVFKFYWALNVAGKQVEKKSNGLVKGFKKGTNSKGQPIFYTFEDLLDEACAHINYKTKFTFIENRNAIFHTGAPAAAQTSGNSTLQAVKPELFRLYGQMQDILLKIFGYHGRIYRYEDPDTPRTFP